VRDEKEEVEEEEVEEEVEEEEEEEEVEEESEIEDDIASEDDETYGEQSLEGFPLSQQEEAREAAELAKSLGLGSTNEAITRVGSQKRVSTTIETYAALIQSNEPEANQVYQGLSEEINVLRSSVHSGINKIVSDTDITASAPAIELAAATLENYLRVITERSVVHCEYRDQEEVSAEDVLVTLSALGRPVYWGEQATSALVQGAIANEEDDEKDSDFVPMDEGEDDADSEDDEEMETWDGKDEVEEETPFHIETSTFRRLIDVLNRWNVRLSDQAYTVLQTSAEDYLGQLFTSASAATQFAGRKEVEPVDVRFAQAVVLKI